MGSRGAHHCTIDAAAPQLSTTPRLPVRHLLVALLRTSITRTSRSFVAEDFPPTFDYLSSPFDYCLRY